MSDFPDWLFEAGGVDIGYGHALIVERDEAGLVTKVTDYHTCHYPADDSKGREAWSQLGGAEVYGRADGKDWDLIQHNPVTLAPSLLCGCGDHGFIRDGKWVLA